MNRLHCGDNLKIMQSLGDASIDLIATDPPFNTGKDWGAFSDKWEWTRDVDWWYYELSYKHGLAISEMITGLHTFLKQSPQMAFLVFMARRLIEMHRLLKDTGSLYLHCDPTSSHYLKVVLDGVFGKDMFRNEIVWKRQSGVSNNVKSKYSTEHDYILFYTNTSDYIFNIQYYQLSQEHINAYYRNVDKQGRRYGIRPICGNDRRKEPTITYLDENKGVPANTIWISNLQLSPAAIERTDYPTQKPEKLYQRIIKASSNAGDVVLDPFCGSGTTCVAAHTLGRKWIGIDKNTDAIKIAEQRLNPPQLSLLGDNTMEVIYHETQ